jgi:hypothetical protein
MAGKTTNISIRMDSDLKAQADALFGELGMNLTTAFNIFVRQVFSDSRGFLQHFSQLIQSILLLQLGNEVGKHSAGHLV